MEVIEQIGAYAGFAALVGLAVLSALYFSQARDVRRLREWAGRAPERAAQDSMRIVSHAATPAGQRAQPAQAAAQAAGDPATVAAQPADPATAQLPAGAQTGAPAEPAAAEQGGEGEPEGEPDTGAPTGTPAAAPAGATSTTAPATAAGAAGAGRPPGANGAPRTTTPLPPKRVLPVGRPAAARPSAVATAPPPPAPWYRRIAPRYLALIAAGVLVLGAGGVYATGQLGSEDEPAPRPAEPAERAPQPSEPVNPGTVTVSVLNGTSVTGLARQIGDDLESRGFQIGNVTNATAEGGERAESAALYVGGARREARAVARALDISQIEAASPEIEQLAGGASVIVVVGLDKTQ